ncbi:MAG: hypothetical protein ACOH5I_13275 [Oligoflexus sp.]
MEIKFNREPYTVRYTQNGEQKTYRRRPPPKLHEMLPSDIVVLTQSKNDDFQAGQEFTVKHINQRQPNILQVTNDQGISTFVDYFDLRMEEMVAKRNGVDPREFPQNNRYLLWP